MVEVVVTGYRFVSISSARSGVRECIKVCLFVGLAQGQEGAVYTALVPFCNFSVCIRSRVSRQKPQEMFLRCLVRRLF